MNVYMLPNLDGIHSALVAANNQKEACRLMSCSLGDFRSFGGRRLPSDHKDAVLATASPGRVFKRDIVAVLVGDCPGKAAWQ